VIERALAVLAVGLACLSPLALAIAALEAAETVSERANQGKFQRILTWSAGLAVAAGAVVRWFVVPHRIATVWIGYRWTQQVTSLLPLPHYGAGSAAVYWLALTSLPPDHRSVMWVNAVLGVVSLPFVGALAWRLFGGWAAALSVAFAAALPIFVRNDTSDANNVPAILALLGAAVAWLGFVDRRSVRSLAAAVLLATLASLARPELVPLAPMLLVLLAWAVRPESSPWRDARVWAGVAFGAVASALQVAHVVGAAAELKQRASLPGLSWERLSEVPRLAVELDVLVRPDLFPVLLSVLGLVAVALPSTRRAAIVMWVVGVANFLFVIVDLDWANVARVQVPTALFVSMAAAGTLGVLLGSKGIPAGIRYGVVVAAVLATGVSSVASATLLWSPTNEEAEEQLIRDAVAALPESPVTLARWGRDDRNTTRDPHGLTHHHFPEYWFRPPFRDDRVVNLSDALAGRTTGPTYVLISFRCYAMFRRASDAAPTGDDQQPTCRRVYDELALEPVFERQATNHGNVWLNYFGTAQAFRVGLYKVIGRSAK